MGVVRGVSVYLRAKLVLEIGLCGSFTTFSTYNADAVNVIGRGEAVNAVQHGLEKNGDGILVAAYLGFSRFLGSLLVSVVVCEVMLSIIPGMHIVRQSPYSLRINSIFDLNCYYNKPGYMGGIRRFSQSI